jgi:hypothetical protein
VNTISIIILLRFEIIILRVIAKNLALDQAATQYYRPNFPYKIDPVVLGSKRPGDGTSRRQDYQSVLRKIATNLYSH